jgi:transposase
MMAVDPAVFDPMWRTVRELIPPVVDRHPLGCHRRRVPDETCWRGIVLRLVTGCSWVDAGRFVGVGGTTLRDRRRQWLRAGVFTRLVTEALEAYDRVVGLDLSEIQIDASQHKAPMGGTGTGANRVDRAKLGYKWSLATDATGIPIAWIVDAANVHDQRLVEDTLDMIEARGYEVEIEQAHLDRGYDSRKVRAMFADAGIQAHIEHRAKPGAFRRKNRTRTHVRGRIGCRWRIERANSWLSNFGQLRRSTERHIINREANIDIAVAFILTYKLVTWTRHHGPTIFV